MHSATAHHPLTHAETAPLANFPPVYILGTTSNGMEYQLGQLSCLWPLPAPCALQPPCWQGGVRS